MNHCQSCGTEIVGRDRFCRQCGVPVATSVADLVDTQQLPYATPPAPTNGQTTHQFYAPPGSPLMAAPASSAQPVSFPRRLLQNKVFWLVVVLLCLSSLATGIAIYAVEERRADRVEQAEEEDVITRHLREVAIQNALGFKHASVSDSEFPNIHGIFVNSLMSDDSAAALAQLQAGDVLLELNGQAVRNESELERALNALKTGDEVPIKIYRDGTTIDSRIRIADRNFPPLMPKVEARDQGFLGIKESRRRCCLPGTQKWGIEVGELHENSPADLFGLKPGDVISEFNGFPTRTPNEFNRRIRATKPRSQVNVKFFRGNTEQSVDVLLGHRWETREY